MPDGCASFLIEDILRSCPPSEGPHFTAMETDEIKTSSDVVCNPLRPPSEGKDRTKDSSSNNSGSTNLSPIQIGSYRSETNEESPSTKYSSESMLFPPIDPGQSNDNLAQIHESVRSQSQQNFPWLRLPSIPGTFFHGGGGYSGWSSTQNQSPSTSNDEEVGETIEYSPHEYASSPSHHQHGNRPKRARITFTPHQVKVLRSKYNLKKYLSNGERLELARELGLSEQQVKIWFQNQRYKEKKRVDREKENAYNQSVAFRPRPPGSPHLRSSSSTASPPIPRTSSSSSGFYRAPSSSSREEHPIAFNNLQFQSPRAPPPPHLLAQLISRAYTQAAPFTGLMSSQFSPFSAAPSTSASYHQDRNADSHNARQSQF